MICGLISEKLERHRHFNISVSYHCKLYQCTKPPFRCVPYSPKKTGKDVPWIRSRHRRTRQAKQVAFFFFFKACPSHVALSVYKSESRRLSKLLRISRKEYESKLADEVKSNRRFFAHVRRNRRLKQRIMALRADDGAVLTDSPNMARILANYYAY